MTKKSAPKKKTVSKKSATVKKPVSGKSKPAPKAKVAPVFSKKPIQAKNVKKTPPKKKSGGTPQKAKKQAVVKKPAKKPQAKKPAPIKKQSKPSPKKSDAKVSAKAQNKKQPTKKAPVKKQAAVKKPVQKQVKNTPSKSKSAAKPAKPAPKKQAASKPATAKPAPVAKSKPAQKSAPKAAPKSAPKSAPKAAPAKKAVPAVETKSARKQEKPVVEKAVKTSKEKSFSMPENTAKRSKTKHLRPSHNIYFSLEDVEAFFSRKDTPLVAVSKESTTAAAKTKSDKSKDSVKTVSNAPKKPLAVATVFDILGINPVVAKTHEKFEEKDVPRKWKKYYTLLVDLRKRFSSGVESRTEEVLKRSAKEDSGDLSSYGQHLADAGSESFERDMAYNLISNQKEILGEIEAAIERIKDGTYGVCEITGEPIPESRLTSIPYTRCTKEGQEIKETELKRQKAKQNSASPYEMPSADGSSSGGEDEAGS